MNITHAHPLRLVLLAVGFCALLLVAAPVLRADEPDIEVNDPIWIVKTLDQQAGKRVKVKLRSGQDVDGIVSKVGHHAVHLTQLAGMEFYDAAVRLDDISAVVVKARGK